MFRFTCFFRQISVSAKAASANRHTAAPRQQIVSPASGYPLSRSTASIPRANRKNIPTIPISSDAPAQPAFQHHRMTLKQMDTQPRTTAAMPPVSFRQKPAPDALASRFSGRPAGPADRPLPAGFPVLASYPVSPGCSAYAASADGPRAGRPSYPPSSAPACPGPSGAAVSPSPSRSLLRAKSHTNGLRICRQSHLSARESHAPIILRISQSHKASPFALLMSQPAALPMIPIRPAPVFRMPPMNCSPALSSALGLSVSVSAST